MSKVLVTESYLEDIADAIRGKNGSSDTYMPSEMAAAITDIPSGGGASNIVSGTFTGTSSGVLSVSLSYTGSGYPIAVIIYPSEGAYNTNGTYYSTIHRYAFDVVAMVKNFPLEAPVYGDSAQSPDQGTVVSIYKSSTSSATSYTRNSSFSAGMFTSGNPSASSSNGVRFASSTEMRVFIASNSYGFLVDTPYIYHVIYSS